MHLLSLPSATVLGLVTFTHLAIGATLQRRNSGNQVNVYSDSACGRKDATSYEGTWNGPNHLYNDANPKIAKPIYVGSVLIMNGEGNFDSLTLNDENIVQADLCQGKGAKMPVWVDSNSNAACYVVGFAVSSASLYTKGCDPPGVGQ